MQIVSEKSNSFPLRLPLSLRRQADDLADRDGLSLNQFISIAVTEKIARMEEQMRVQAVETSNAKPPVIRR
jgi:hypothetical protein